MRGGGRGEDYRRSSVSSVFIKLELSNNSLLTLESDLINLTQTKTSRGRFGFSFDAPDQGLVRCIEREPEPATSGLACGTEW